MSDTVYVPSGGITGKVKRLAARRLARAPLSIPSDRKIVSITFDDFPKSAVDVGASILEARDWRGTWYASMGFMGGDTHHGAMFDAGDIERLANAGHEIACHSWSHMDAASAPLETFMADAARNTEELQGLGAQIDSFAYPYGEASPASKTALGRRYASLRGVQRGINRHGADRHLLKAVGIDGGQAGIDTALQFAKELSDAPGWLIYYVHDIQDDPTPWGCTPEQFNRVLDAIAASGSDVLTVGDAVRALADA